MTIEYQTYMARQMNTGGDINIEGVKWFCVVPCTLIGRTLEGNIPVIAGLDGPALNENQLVRADRFKTPPKAGQTPTEAMTLAEYEGVNSEALVGKELKFVCRMDKIFIVICHDKTYVKFSAGREQYDDDLTLDNECLTLDDLRRLDIIADSTWQRHLEEEREIRMKDTARRYDQHFKEAVHRVGKDRAKELLERS